MEKEGLCSTISSNSTWLAWNSCKISFLVLSGAGTAFRMECQLTLVFLCLVVTRMPAFLLFALLLYHLRLRMNSACVSNNRDLEIGDIRC
jgi:hypothetical protein